MNSDGQHHMYETCKNHMHQYVIISLADGNKIAGVIEDVNETALQLIVPITEAPAMEHSQQQYERNSPYGYYPGYYPNYYPYYPYYPGYGYRRIILPLAALVALSTLPYFW